MKKGIKITEHKSADAVQGYAAQNIKVMSATELGLLLMCPYERPQSLGNGQDVKRLVQEGYLEENPTGPGFFRCTERGLNVLRYHFEQHRGQL